MQKDFDTWNSVKKDIDQNDSAPYFHERELWWVSCGINIGVEMDGKHDFFERPCLILRQFNKKMAWVLPTTSREKDDRFHASFMLGEKTCYIALTQIKTIDSKRLLRKAGMLSAEDFASVRNRMAGFLKMNEDPHKAGLLGGRSHNQ
jgi:mRNA interferase MazF